jgi:protein SCO1
MNISKAFRTAISTIVAGMLLAATSCSLLPSSYHGEVVNPVVAAPSFSMMDQNGNPFELNAMPGQLTLVFFGFTNCVDECPLTLAHLKQARDSLGEKAENVRVVLVSTDPVRDTPAVLRDYLKKFDSTFIGITGPAEELSRIWSDYGVTVLDGGETHTSYTYVIDHDGNLRLHFDPEMSPEDIAADLQTLLASQ